MQWKLLQQRKDAYHLQIRRQILSQIFAAKRKLLLSSEDEIPRKLRPMKICQMTHPIKIQLKIVQASFTIQHKLINKVKQFLSFSGNKFILNSSPTLQIQSIYNIRKTKWPFKSLKSLKKHVPLSLQIGIYSEKGKSICNITEQMQNRIEMKQNDFQNFFLFQIIRCLPKDTALQERTTQEIVKNIILQKSRDIIIINKFNFLFMREYLQYSDGKIGLRQCCLESTYEKILTKYFISSIIFKNIASNKTNNVCRNFYKNQVHNQGRNSVRRQCFYAQQLIAKGASHFELGFDSFRRILNTNVVLDKFFIESSHDSELIPLKYDTVHQKITFFWSPRELVQIAADFVFPSKICFQMTSIYTV